LIEGAVALAAYPELLLLQLLDQNPSHHASICHSKTRYTTSPWSPLLSPPLTTKIQSKCLSPMSPGVDLVSHLPLSKTIWHDNIQIEHGVVFLR
jgi:hypothetical protein